MELPSCGYIHRRENVIAVGHSGTGNTPIALGLGQAPCQRGMAAVFTTADGLVHELKEPETKDGSSTCNAYCPG